MKPRLASFVLACVVVLTGANGASGQGKTDDGDISSLFPVDDMINQATDNISRRYNLNDAQRKATQKMMHERVNRFLSEHQDEMYPLIRDLTRSRFQGKNLSVEQRKRIGKLAKPLIDEAKEAILEANREWGNMLSPEQQRLHEWDLREMDNQFEQIHDNLGQLAKGEAVDNPLFPEPKIETPEPPRPRRPDESQTPPLVSDGPVQQQVAAKGDVFDEAVAKFIKDYGLDAAQAGTARSIGREFKQRAEQHRRSHRVEMQDAQRKIDEARRAGDLKKVKEAEAELDKINGRIREFLQQMSDRLGGIPTEAQKRAYDEKHAAKGKSPSTAPAAKKDVTKKSDKSKTKREPAKKASKQSTGGKSKDRE